MGRLLCDAELLHGTALARFALVNRFREGDVIVARVVFMTVLTFAPEERSLASIPRPSIANRRRHTGGSPFPPSPG